MVDVDKPVTLKFIPQGTANKDSAFECSENNLIQKLRLFDKINEQIIWVNVTTVILSSGTNGHL